MTQDGYTTVCTPLTSSKNWWNNCILQRLSQWSALQATGQGETVTSVCFPKNVTITILPQPTVFQYSECALPYQDQRSVLHEQLFYAKIHVRELYCTPSTHRYARHFLEHNILIEQRVVYDLSDKKLAQTAYDEDPIQVNHPLPCRSVYTKLHKICV